MPFSTCFCSKETLSARRKIPAGKKPPKTIPAKFTRTADGYIYEIAFPAWSVLPAKLKKGSNLGFALYVADRDSGSKVKQAYSLTVEKGKSPYMKPHLWPLLILAD